MNQDKKDALYPDYVRMGAPVSAPIASTPELQQIARQQAAPAPEVQLVPKWAGQFHSYQDWVNKAQSRLASPDHRRAMCVDAKGRRCAIGKDFMLARDEDAFPVRYFWECELAAAPAHPAPHALLDHAHAEPVAHLQDANEKAAELTLKLRADSGYSADQKARISATQWGKICAIIAGEVSQGAAPTAADVRDAALEEAIEVCKAGRAWRLADDIRALKRAAQPNIQEAGNA